MAASPQSYTARARTSPAIEHPEEAARAILDLARADGWLGVYDPSNPSGRRISEAGGALSLQDGLGNLPELVADDSAHAPSHRVRAFGLLDGLSFGSGGVAHRLRSGALPEALRQPNFVLVLTRAANAVATTGTSRFAVDGTARNPRHSILISQTSGTPTWAVYAGQEREAVGGPIDTDPHLLGVLFQGGEGTRLWIDELEFSTEGATGGFDHPFSSFTLGDRFSGQGNHWVGDIGLLLFYDGVPSRAVLDRMRRLILALMHPDGYRSDALKSSTAVSRYSSGPALFEKGADQLRIPASMIKILTAYAARQTVTDDLLDEMVVVNETDGLVGSGTSPRLHDGDRVSFRSLFYLSMLPSHNGAARALARSAGERLPGSDSTGAEKLLLVMRDLADRWGWRGANIVEPSGLNRRNRLSANMIAELLYRIAEEDPLLLEIMGTLRQEIRIEGRQARTVIATHTIQPGTPPHIPEFIAGKTGTLRSVGGSVAMLTRDQTGALRATVTMIAQPPRARYSDVRAILDDRATTTITLAETLSDNAVARAVTDPTSITRREMDELYAPGRRATRVLDVSSRFPQADLSARGSRITLQRRGDLVELTIAAARFPADARFTEALPEGFRPSAPVFGIATANRGGAGVRQLVVRGRQVRVFGNHADETLRATLSWLTAAPFPEAETTL